MNASAAIFEALSDVDSKFVKIADKEYDGISAEVKKWFKKLAVSIAQIFRCCTYPQINTYNQKEEKAHDDKMSNANTKIKQASMSFPLYVVPFKTLYIKGQAYEKKSKKNLHDVTEEHARYVNLISTLGPEMSQEK
jgi:hypothetical protein